jgi:hypothetical protein
MLLLSLSLSLSVLYAHIASCKWHVAVALWYLLLSVILMKIPDSPSCWTVPPPPTSEQRNLRLALALGRLLVTSRARTRTNQHKHTIVGSICNLVLPTLDVIYLPQCVLQNTTSTDNSPLSAEIKRWRMTSKVEYGCCGWYERRLVAGCNFRARAFGKQVFQVRELQTYWRTGMMMLILAAHTLPTLDFVLMR